VPVPTPTADVTPPGRVTGIGAGSTGERCEIVVGWAPNPASDQVDHYNVYRSNAPGVEAVPANLVGSAPAEATHYSDTGLTPGTYYYVITAVDAAGNEGPISQEDVLPLTGCRP
jgi:fibronectin type 3 domain-containing protein